VKLETPGKIWLVVLAPPSRMENRGDEGRHLEAAEERIYTNLMTPLSHSG
jgi:hypothetical protein